MALEWSAGSGRLDAGGHSLEWACWGAVPDGTLPMIVLLHEGLGAVALWRDFPARLAEATGCPVMAYSRAGHGLSQLCELPRPLDFMTNEACIVLAEILGQIGNHPIILVGHSDGATIAAEYAGRVSDARVCGIVLIAPHFFTEEMGLAEISKTAEAFETTDLKQRLAKYHSNPMVTFGAWSGVWLSPDFKSWNVAEVIDCWRIPALIIQGVDDQYGTVAQVKEAKTRSHAPVEVTLLNDCRHAPHFDQPQKTLQTIAEFIARLRRTEDARVAAT